jgi:hypothetical protein
MGASSAVRNMVKTGIRADNFVVTCPWFLTKLSVEGFGSTLERVSGF